LEKEKPLPSLLRRKRLFLVFILNDSKIYSIFFSLSLWNEKILRNGRHETNHCFAGRMNCCGRMIPDSGMVNCCGRMIPD
jgi:hypothetical protein